MLNDFTKFAFPYKFLDKENLKNLLKDNFASTLVSDEVFYKLIQQRDPYIIKVKALDKQQ